MAIDINQALIDAGIKYKKQLLSMPLAALAKVFPYVTIEPGLQGKTMGGVLTTDAELRPYRTEKGASDNTAITPFEWETYLGDVVKEFDPYKLMGTLYTSPTATKPTEQEIAKRVALEMARKVGHALYLQLFKAVRNPLGETTSTLFNGYAALIQAQITAGNVSLLNGNYLDKSGTQMTVDNVGDILVELWEGAQEELKDIETLMYIPSSILEMYNKWYQLEYSVQAPWTNGNAPKILPGTNDMCTLVPLGNMGGTPFIFISVKENVKIGVDQMSDTEKVEIRRCDNPKMVQFFMTSYFGVGFETFDKTLFKAMRYTSSAIVPIANLANSAKAATTATFTWTAPTGATSQLLQQSLDGLAWVNCATAAAITATSATAQATGLTAETEYQFRVIVTGGQNAGTSNVVTLTTTA